MSIDFSQIPAPAVVQPLDFEAELQRLKVQLANDLREHLPEIDDLLQLESEPLLKTLQRIAYEHVSMQARINDSAHAVMLAYAVGSDLDQLAANYGVQRLPGETDTQLRRRTQLAFEGLTVAGSKGSYIFHALSADAQVQDALPITPTPGTVSVVVLARDGDGTASPELLATVLTKLSADDVRPMNDTVEVVSAQVQPFTVQAQLRAYPGPTQATVLERATSSLQDYLASCRKLGYDVTESGLKAALHVLGVQKVLLTQPDGDVSVQAHQVAHCTAVDLSIAEGSFV